MLFLLVALGQGYLFGKQFLQVSLMSFFQDFRGITPSPTKQCRQGMIRSKEWPREGQSDTAESVKTELREHGCQRVSSGSPGAPSMVRLQTGPAGRLLIGIFTASSGAIGEDVERPLALSL